MKSSIAVAALGLVLAGAQPAEAGSITDKILGEEARSNPMHDALVISKMTGACGMVKQMAAFQEATKMPGGDDFLMRFMTTEAARLGETPLGFLERCKGAIEFYVELTKAAGSAAPQDSDSMSKEELMAIAGPPTAPAAK